MKYVTLAACLCACACHSVPDADNSIVGDDDAQNASVGDGGDMDQLGDGGTVVARQAFRSTDGLVASYSMRTPDPSRILDDLPGEQHLDLETLGSGTTAEMVRTTTFASGLMTSAQERINTSGVWTIETWVELIGSRVGDLVTSGNIRLHVSSVSSTNSVTLTQGVGSSVTGKGATTYGLHHVVATNDGNAVRLYVNGFLVGSSIAQWTEDFGDTLRWGGDGFDGTLEFLALYDRALTHGEIALHMLVGKDPKVTDDRLERGETFYAVQSQFAATRAVDAFDVSISEDGSSSDRLELSVSQRAIQHADLRMPLPQGDMIHASYRHITGDLTEGSTVELFPMLKPWSTAATWDEFTTGSPWGMAGGGGPSDRGDRVGQVTITHPTNNPDRNYLRFDVTETVQGWLSDGVSFGWMLTSNSVEVDDIDSIDSQGLNAGRPALLIVGESAQRPDPPALPMFTSSLEVGDRNVEVKWSGSAPLYEVYLGDELNARIADATIVLIEPAIGQSIQIVAVDDFGQFSAAVDAENPRQ